MGDAIENFFGNQSEHNENRKLNCLNNEKDDVEGLLREEEWDSTPEDTLEETEDTRAFLSGLTSRRFSFKKNYRKIISIAAILVFGIGIVTFIFNKTPKSLSGRTTPLWSEPLMQVYANSSAKEQIIALPDSSQIVLYSGSKVVFLKNFQSDKRKINLYGKAFFKVHKDASRPFTVVCNNVATTALGTEFSVTADEKSKNVLIYLKEGKILVQLDEKSKTDSRKYYLLPDNAIEFSHAENKFVMKLNNKNSNTPVTNSGNMKSMAVTNTVAYNDVQLTIVLDDLAKRYNTKIIYPTGAIQKIRFLGNLKKNQPLYEILSDIAVMNNLTVTKDSIQNEYILGVKN